MSQQQLDQYTKYLIDEYVPITLFVDQDLNILYTHGKVEHYLNFPRALVRFNLSKMLSGAVLSLFRRGVKECLAGDGPVLFRQVKFEKDSDVHLTDIRLQRARGAREGQPLVLVELIPVRLDEQPDGRPEAIREYTSDGNQELENLERELKEARQTTQNLIDEQEATNEELQASNRELMASNEELQSTNEELQSVNEELYTVNSELQIKNEALSTANNDILNLLKSIEIGTIFLDRELNVRRFTPAARKHFNLLDSDIGRSISDFSTNLLGVDVSKISREAYLTLDKYEQEVMDRQGNHYLLRVLPYRTQDDQIQGVVITFVDVNELIRMRERMMAFARKFKAIFQNAEDTILDLDEEGVIKNVNDPVGLRIPDDLIGSSFFDLVPEGTSHYLKTEMAEMTTSFHSVHFDFEIDKGDDFSNYQGTLIPLVEGKDEASKLVGMIVVLHDITVYVKEYQQMIRHQQKYKAFMDNARYQIVLVDRKGRVRYINFPRADEDERGVRIDDLIYDHLPEEARLTVRQSINNIFGGKSFETIRFSFTGKDGRKRDIELSATPVTIENEVRYAALIGSEGNSL